MKQVDDALLRHVYDKTRLCRLPRRPFSGQHFARFDAADYYAVRYYDSLSMSTYYCRRRLLRRRRFK